MSKLFINGVDTQQTYGAYLIDRNIQTAEIVNFEDWIRQSIRPTVIAQEEHYIKIDVTLEFTGSSDNTILTNISNLIKSAEKTTINFDDINYYYDVFIESKNTTRIFNNVYELTISFKSGYAYLPQVTQTANAVTSVTVNNAGNTTTPAIIEITPTVNMGSLTFGSFTINNLTSGQQVIISSVDYTVLQGTNNKYADFSGTFPTLAPGNNVISISNNGANINIKYKPQFI